MVTLCPNRFNSQKFDILPTDYICAFNLNLITNREFVFIKEVESVYCAVRVESLNIIQFNLS